MRRPSLRSLVAFTAPALVGGAVGDALLDQMNTPHPALVAALARSPSAPARPRASNAHVVLVLVDGVGAAFFEESARRGTLRPVAWSQPIDTGTPSLSRPGYHVLFTGVAQDVAGVRNNRFVDRARADTIMDRVRDAGGGVAWALETVDWMHRLAGAPGETYLRGAAALDVDRLAALARERSLLVVHWTATDGAGHEHGARSREYADVVRASLTRASALHDRLSAALGPSGFTLFVGSDHGHSAVGGHGGPEPEVTRVRWVRLGGAPAPAIAIQPATRMAATVTDALGLPAPRQSTGCSLASDGASSECAAITARREVIDRALRQARSRSTDRSRVALALLAPVVAASSLAAARAERRRRIAAACVGTLAVLAGAAAGFAALGPGWTLTAIRTHESFLARALTAQAIGVIAAWWAVRRLTRVRAEDVALASALAPLGAMAWALGSPGPGLLGDVARLVAPATGLLPTAVCAVLGAWSLLDARGDG